VLLSLRDLGNTVIVVEHEDIMKAADMIIDIGPRYLGGNLVAQGTYSEILVRIADCKYLNGDLEITVPKKAQKVQKLCGNKRCS
jgi:excinuclease ABC subunit A